MRKFFLNGIVLILLLFSIDFSFAQQNITAILPAQTSIVFSPNVKFSWNNHSNYSNQLLISTDSLFSSTSYRSGVNLNSMD